MIRYEYDVAWDMEKELLVFLGDLIQKGVEVAYYKSRGPGGGNPVVVLDFPDEKVKGEFDEWYSKDAGVCAFVWAES